MNHVKREALVPYTPEQMYHLVNDIAGYPKFLHWCRSARIVSQTEQEIIATLVIAKAGIHKAFTTKNMLSPFEKIEIALVDGPFKHLSGCWKFSEKPNGCTVSVDLSFEFSSHILALMLGPIFQEIAQTLVHAFIQEAHHRYGHSTT